MKWKLVILAFGILLLFAAVYDWRTRPTQQDVIQKVFGNQQNYDAFVSSQKVTAQLLHKQDEANSTKLKGYSSDAPISLSSEQIQKIKFLLQNPPSYLWNIGNSCIPDYGVLFTFHSDQRTVRVAVCFECDMLGVFDSEDNSAGQINSEYIIDPMHAQLVALAKSIFPNDTTIQSLKEKRH